MVVRLHDNTEKLGGSWQGGRDGDGHLLVWDQPLIKFFYDQMMKIDAPRMLDIGANTGSFCLLIKAHPGARCVAFEPAWDAYNVLKWNVAANGLGEQVSVRRQAVMDRPGKYILKVPHDLGSAGLATLGQPMRFKGYGTQEVEAITIDSLNLDCVNLVKIDVEGAELLVLKGMVETIGRDHPAILLEWQDSTKDFCYDRSDTIAWLKGHGYDTLSRIGKGDLWCVSHTS